MIKMYSYPLLCLLRMNVFVQIELPLVMLNIEEHRTL